MKTLSIDIETFSDRDLNSCGVYKYASSPFFCILLFAYSVDGGEVQVVDLMAGQEIPDDVLEALTDSNVTKWAYNAVFERVCLSEYLRLCKREFFKGYGDDATRKYISPKGWKCTMTWAAYMGLPLSLRNVGLALKLDEKKMEEGKDLIRYFCMPCKTTNTNGGRTRNLPAHAPDKWKVFKAYNKRDVEVEMAVQHKLRHFPVPEFVWEEYWLDQEINDRGIMLDMPLVNNAISFDDTTREALMERMKQITEVENPNSVQQMKAWLKENGLEMESLGKKEVAAVLRTAPPELAEALTIRQMLSKSSVRKYRAMQNAVCIDGRARGLFMFYGANRSGRFSSKIIQIQNLYRNSMPDLDEARELVRSNNYKATQLLYDNIPETLSELIRTAFIPKPGYKFIVSDFSAIEARVLSWLAKEQWRMDTFASGGDIYCATASKMFHCNVVKHGENGELRQKGKAAELACIAEGELVLTNHGLIPIEKVTLDDLVWDGTEWVQHDGVIYKGEREVITYEGLTATKDHLVWVEGQSRPIHFGVAAASGAHLLQTGDGRRAIRLGEDYKPGETVEQADESLLCSNSVYGLWSDTMADQDKLNQRQIKRLPKLFETKTNTFMARQKVNGSETQMREPQRSGISSLWRTRNTVRLPKRYRGRTVFNIKVWDTGSHNGIGSHRYKRRLCSGQFTICRPSNKLCESAEKRIEQIRARILAVCSQCSSTKAIPRFDKRSNNTGCRDCCIREKKKLANNSRTSRLYDIRNAGRYHRFTVSGKLVHNCGYGGSRGALISMGALESGMKEEELKPLVDAWREANPNIVKLWYAVDSAAKKAVQNKTTTETHGIKFICQSGMLFIELPSGRRLSYVKPMIGENKFGGQSVTYMGQGIAKKWERIETFSGKLVENITQAIARDILCFAMNTLRNYRIVATVHDEIIIECPQDTSLEFICKQMSITPPWAEGLVLNADGDEMQYYQKS